MLNINMTTSKNKSYIKKYKQNIIAYNRFDVKIIKQKLVLIKCRD